MIEFRMFGTLQLTDAAGHEVKSLITRPRRLALLAYLAASSGRELHRRDTLLALFWPELDQEHARAALRQALHVLRTALGADVVVTRGPGAPRSWPRTTKTPSAGSLRCSIGRAIGLQRSRSSMTSRSASPPTWRPSRPPKPKLCSRPFEPGRRLPPCSWWALFSTMRGGGPGSPGLVWWHLRRSGWALGACSGRVPRHRPTAR